MVKRILLAICLFATFATVPRVWAAEGEGLATASGVVVLDASQPVVEENFAAELTALQSVYRQQLADYREKERLYVIAKQQFAQIQTLAALEEGVQRTREVMVARDQVLETYVQILRVSVEAANGIELVQKNDSLDQLLALQQSLKQHEIDTEGASDRLKIAAQAKAFSSFTVSLDSVTSQAIARIGLGNLQAVYDKTQTIKSEVEDSLSSTEQDTFALAQKRRGFDEITRTLSDVDTQLQKSRAAVAVPWDRAGRSTLNSFLEDLNQIFSGLSRGVSYLDETTR